MSAPDDYNPDRFHETWRERHGWSDKARRNQRRLTKSRRKNKEPGRFGKANWEAYQHDQLYDMIMKADVGRMTERAVQWNELAAKIEGTTSRAQAVMTQVMAAWRGQAAVSAGESNTRLMQWAGDASHRAGLIAEGMSTYTNAVERAQSHMPQPGFSTAERNFREGYTVTGTGGPSTAILLKQLLSDGMVSHEEARSRKAEAVQVMETYEAQSKDVHDTMPEMVDDAPTTTSDDGSTWSPPPDGGQGGPDGSGGPGTPTPPVTPPATALGGSTTAAGYVDPRFATTGGLPGGGTGGPGVPGGPGGGGGGVPGYGGGLGSLGSGGSDIVRGTPGLGGGAGVGPVPAGARGGAAGLPPGARGGVGAGAFGGMPMGHGAQGEEDGEHKNKYDQGMDFFDDLPPAYPSVFGA
jgi:hypothetical protein